MMNESGGVEGYKIVPIYVDAQSKTDTAINEATRLLDQEGANLLLGMYSSAQCVPMAQKVDAAKQFMWINQCAATNVLKGKNLHYVFRPGVHSDQYGAASCTFLNQNSKTKLNKDPKDLKIAIIYEDGPWGTGVASVNEQICTKYGMQIVLKEAYTVTTPDMSSPVTKLRRALPM